MIQGNRSIRYLFAAAVLSLLFVGGLLGAQEAEAALNNTDCIQCHGDVAADPLPIHHATGVTNCKTCHTVVNASCTDCHGGPADPVYHENAHTRIDITAECADCHGNGQVVEIVHNNDCYLCHTNPDPVVSASISAGIGSQTQNCNSCHTIAADDPMLNPEPVANSGGDQTVVEKTDFFLDGSGSYDDDAIVSYRWVQTSGTPVLPADPYETDTAVVTVTAPEVDPNGAILTFELRVIDSGGKESTPCICTVEVKNVMTGSVRINEGARYATGRDVTLSLDNEDAVAMRIANDDDSFAGDFIPFASSGAWTLSPEDGMKTVKVQFQDVLGNVIMSASTIVLDTSVPGTPRAVFYTDGMEAEFNWTPMAGADMYRFQYAPVSNFRVGTVTIDDVASKGLVLAPETFSSGTWYWRVMALDSAGNASEWSSVQKFRKVGEDTFCTGPEAPVLQTPYYGAADVERDVILVGSDMDYPAACGSHRRTEWQISESSDFRGSLIVHVASAGDNLTSYQVPNLALAPETGYFWRVRHIASDGTESPWSSSGYFTTDAGYDAVGENGILYLHDYTDTDGVEAARDRISINTMLDNIEVKLKSVRASSGVIVDAMKKVNPLHIMNIDEELRNKLCCLLNFRLIVEPGSTADVVLFLGKAAPMDAVWYNYDPMHGWYPYEAASFDRSNRVIRLFFQDGGLGDADGVANGVIITR